MYLCNVCNGISRDAFGIKTVFMRIPHHPLPRERNTAPHVLLGSLIGVRTRWGVSTKKKNQQGTTRVTTQNIALILCYWPTLAAAAPKAAFSSADAVALTKIRAFSLACVSRAFFFFFEENMINSEQKVKQNMKSVSEVWFIAKIGKNEISRSHKYLN